jgi:MFS superfamily sulfate permease-like transporter
VKEALQTTGSQRLVYGATALAVLFIDLIWGVIIGLTIDFVSKQLQRRRNQN